MSAGIFPKVNTKSIYQIAMAIETKYKFVKSRNDKKNDKKDFRSQMARIA